MYECQVFLKLSGKKMIKVHKTMFSCSNISSELFLCIFQFTLCSYIMTPWSVNCCWNQELLFNCFNTWFTIIQHLSLIAGHRRFTDGPIRCKNFTKTSFSWLDFNTYQSFLFSCLYSHSWLFQWTYKWNNFSYFWDFRG